MVRRLGFDWILASLCACFGAHSSYAEIVKIHPPPGFETPVDRERTLVDVYLFDQFVAETPAGFDSNTITFDDALGLARALPNIKDQRRVEQALARPLETNSNLACGSVIRRGSCGFIHTDEVAVIFDVARFRVDLILNPRFTFARDPRFKYLPAPTHSPGLLTHLNSRSIYDFDRRQLTGTHSLRGVAGYGRWAVRVELVTDLERTTLLRNVFAERSGRDRAFAVGLFPRQAESALVQSEQLLGVRLATSSNARLDRARLGASVLDISVTQSAVVEIRRDGDILDVQRVEPDQRQLDTSRLPQGTYSVDLEIREGDQVRVETQYFSSFGSLPPQDEPRWFVELGQAVPFNTRNLEPLSDGIALLSFGRHQRLNSVWAWRLSGAVADTQSHAELGMQLAYPNFTGDVSWVTTPSADQGVALRGRGTIGAWQVSGSFRQVVEGTSIALTDPAVYDPLPRAFRQARASASRTTDWGRYGARGFYRENASGEETWFLGSHIDFAILDKDNWRLNLDLRGELGSDRNSSFIGVRLSKSFRTRSADPWRGRLTTLANSDLLQSRLSGERDIRRVLEAEIRAHRRYNQNERLTVFGGIRQEDLYGVRAGGEFQSARLTARMDARRTYQNQNSVSMDLQSGLVLGPNGLSFTSSSEDSGVQVQVDGARSSRFAVQVNQQRRGVTSAHGSGFAPLRPFAIHDVAITPLIGSEIDYDQSAERFIAYPGNLMSLVRKVRPIAIFIGQLMDESGGVLSDALLTKQAIIGATDRDGYFQIDGAPGDRILVEQGNGAVCAFSLPDMQRTSLPYLDAGRLTCRPVARSNAEQ